MKNSNKNQEAMISENLEKSLRDWKLPPSSALDVFEAKGASSSCFPNCSIKTVEKEFSLRKGFATFPLFSRHRKRVHQICYGYLHIGMIQVGVKPTELGSNTSATIILRDKRLKDPASVLGMAESSLCDGPIYFSYFPTHCVAMSDSCDSFAIDVKIRGSGGDKSVTLMYRFHYRVVKYPYLMDFSSRFSVDESGKTTLYLTNIAQNNHVVSKRISWGRTETDGEGLVVENDVAASGDVNVDWKETVKAHVLKVDVPGFKKEDVKVEVEGGRILRISGERSNEEEEESGKWHRVERSKGKFLRRFRLPEDVKLDEVKAAVENGVLTVTVPKEEVDKKVEVKVIHISG